ncbi:hypothetical protein [Acidianus ambivalens]|uniref:hypothetical protein n=1 Tax=Acidianus ambivalens TaxID=2283 RepID=UPI0018C88E08
MVVGLIWWTVPFVTIGYLMSIEGYLGLIRRVIAYPAMFVPYMELISFLAEVGIPGLVLTISTALGEFIKSEVSTSTSIQISPLE